MKALMEKLRGARYIELILGITLLALLTLVLTNDRTPEQNDIETSALERRLERLLSGIEGVEGVRTMITQNEKGDVRGVVIVTDTSLSIRCVLEIQTAVQALLDIDAAHVNIISRESVIGGDYP